MLRHAGLALGGSPHPGSMAEKGNPKRPLAINTSCALLVRASGTGWESQNWAMERQTGIRYVPGGLGISLLNWPVTSVNECSHG